MLLQQALETISSGRITSVVFSKRTDGTTRRMLCRAGVRKHLQGGPAAYDSKAKDLLVVWDLQKLGYRSIPIEGIKMVNGKAVRSERAGSDCTSESKTDES